MPKGEKKRARRPQLGGGISFARSKDGRVISKAESDIEFEIYHPNDFINLELLQNCILPLLQFNKQLFPVCNADNPLTVKSTLKTVNEGGFGVGFTFDCTYVDKHEVLVSSRTS